MVVLIGTLSGVSMYLGTLEKPIYNSGMTPIFTLVWAGYVSQERRHYALSRGLDSC